MGEVTTFFPCGEGQGGVVTWLGEGRGATAWLGPTAWVWAGCRTRWTYNIALVLPVPYVSYITTSQDSLETHLFQAVPAV